MWFVSYLKLAFSSYLFVQLVEIMVLKGPQMARRIEKYYPKVKKFLWGVGVTFILTHYELIGHLHFSPWWNQWERSEDYKKWSALPPKHKGFATDRYHCWVLKNI